MFAAVLAGLLLPLPGGAQEAIPVGALVGQTHIHGLAVDRGDPDYLLIATHHGLFRAGPDGLAIQISIVQDFMGFSPHPTEPAILFASGHPAGGGNLGFIISTDGGRTWSQRSLGVGGPVDFHQMAVSPIDPNVIFGVYGGLQVSRDAGMTWNVVARFLPPQLIDLAASAVDADTLYAATERGLYVSTNGGVNWQLTLPGAPVSLVTVGPDGSLYAFVLGRGLLRAPDESAPLEPVGSNWPEPYLFHLAIDPSDPSRMFAATGAALIVVSVDGGATWEILGD